MKEELGVAEHVPACVFLSPSKRKPKRASLLKVDTRSPLRSAHASNWEARHDVNNLDHYQSKVKEPIANERKRRTSQPSNLVKSSSSNAHIHPAKKPKPSPKKNVRFQVFFYEYILNKLYVLYYR